MMTKAEKTKIITGLIASVPYVVIAWGYTKFDSDVSFWQALGVLLAVRLVFSIIETLGGMLAWRFYGRAYTVKEFVQILHKSKFPQRYYQHDDLLNYLARIEDDLNLDADVRRAAREVGSSLELYESMGILIGLRMHSASEQALEIYSPRDNAPATV
jgi:hypothetical protein